MQHFKHVKLIISLFALHKLSLYFRTLQHCNEAVIQCLSQHVESVYILLDAYTSCIQLYECLSLDKAVQVSYSMPTKNGKIYLIYCRLFKLPNISFF